MAINRPNNVRRQAGGGGGNASSGGVLRQSSVDEPMAYQEQVTQTGPAPSQVTEVFENFDLTEDVVAGNVARGITTGLFSGNDGQITDFFSGSNGAGTDAKAKYYWDVYHKALSDNTTEVQFNVAFGHYAGSGSVRETGATVGMSPSRAVYSQFRNLLLDNPSPSSKFSFEDNTTSDRMIFITLNRSRFKQKFNVGNWQLDLGKSTVQRFHLIDDSNDTPAGTENGHTYYNIISGSGTTPFISGSARVYLGKVYPELGILALHGDKLLGGTGVVGNGFMSTLSANANDGAISASFTAIKDGANFTARAEEDISSTHFFIRAKNGRTNFSTNPTFRVTGSSGQLKHTSMIGDPNVYITTVGLYNQQNELCAVAKLSKPLLKNYEREATIRVKLDY